MATKPNPLTALAKARITPDTKAGIDALAADRRETAGEVVRAAIDQHLAKAGGPALDPATADRVAELVADQVARAVNEATRRLEPLGDALVLVAERLDQIEAAQGRRAA